MQVQPEIDTRSLLQSMAQMPVTELENMETLGLMPINHG